MVTNMEKWEWSILQRKEVLKHYVHLSAPMLMLYYKIPVHKEGQVDKARNGKVERQKRLKGNQKITLRIQSINSTIMIPRLKMNPFLSWRIGLRIWANFPSFFIFCTTTFLLQRKVNDANYPDGNDDYTHYCCGFEQWITYYLHHFSFMVQMTYILFLIVCLILSLDY